MSSTDWISVKDRLPEKEREYFIFCESLHERAVVEYRKDWGWQRLNVTHWLDGYDLPDPPKEADDE